MDDYRFKHIPQDALVLGIGSLFKKNSNQYWGVNLSLSKKVDRPSIPLAGAPLIRRFKTLSANQSNTKKGKLLTFVVDNAQLWNKKRLKEYPAISSIGGVQNTEQWCFEITNSDGKVIYLPQFELARVLFLHDNYMSRICLEHDKLSSDFNISYTDDGGWLIEAMPSSSYPLASYNDEKCRRFLSWILMDPQARASFESMHQVMMKEHQSRGQYRMWDFSFLPPSLEGVKLEVAGWHDWNTDSFFVWEIRRIEDLPSDMPEDIDFFHPDFERSITGKDSGSYAAKAERLDAHEIDADEDADPNRKRIVLDTDSVSLTFKKPFKTNRKTSKSKRTPRGAPDDSEPGELSPQVSPNDGAPTGSIPGADFDVSNDESDDAHLYANKFSCFFKMIECLEKNHGCQVHRYQLRKLPKVAGCKKHMLADDTNPRCLALIKVTYQEKRCYIVEVDTSDAKAAISTMILRLKNNGHLLAHLDELELRLVKKSITWPRDYLQQICGEGNFTGVSHPSCKHKGLLDPADIDKWAERLIVWLEE